MFDYTLLEWILAIMLGLTIALSGGVLARELWRRMVKSKLQRRGRQIRELIQKFQSQQRGEINKLLFSLKDQFDSEEIEHVLKQLLEESQRENLEFIRELFRYFELSEHYIAELKSPRWRVRAEAAYTLGLLGDPKAIPYLIERMKDPNEDEQNVKMACAQALGMIRDPAAIPYLISALEEVNQWSSVKVAEILVKFGEKAVPDLLQALQNDKNTNQRIWAAQILGRIGSKSAIPFLIQRLRDRDSRVRVAAVEALGRLETKVGIQQITELLLKDPVPEVRAQAAIALGRIGDEIALHPLIEALNDPEYWTRVRAVEALEAIGEKYIDHFFNLLQFDPRVEVRRRAAQALERLGVVEKKISELLSENRELSEDAKRFLVLIAKNGQIHQLQSYLSDPDFRIRAKVCEILGESGEASALSSLIRAAEDPVWVVRIKAIESLVKFGTSDAIKAVGKALSEADDVQKPLILEAVKQLPPSQLEELYPHLILLTQDDNLEVREYAIESISNFPREETYQALLAATYDPFPEIRELAVEGLGKLDYRDAADRLIELLSDSERSVRIRAARYLGQWREESALSALIQALNTDNLEERRAISSALSNFGLENFYEKIDELMGNDSPLVKIGICWVLGETRDPRAVRLLSFFLYDSQSEVRCAALGSLGRIPHPSAAAAAIKAVEDVNKKVRASAVNALLRIGTLHEEQDLKKLSKLLDDPDFFVRNRTALAMGVLGDNPWVQELLIQKFQEYRDWEFRHYLLLGMALIRSRRTFQFVLPYFRNPDVRSELLEKLRREDPATEKKILKNLSLDFLRRDLSPQEILDRYLTKLQQSQDPDERLWALDALEVIADTQSISFLFDSLWSDPSPEVRVRAAELLPKLTERLPERREEIISALLRAAKDPVPQVASSALLSLKEISTTAQIPTLFEFLNSKEKLVRKTAAKVLISLAREEPKLLCQQIEETDDLDLKRRGILALRYLQDPEVTQFLTEFLSRPDPKLKAAAIRALSGHLSSNPQIVEQLLPFLKDPSREVRFWTLQTLPTTNLEKFWNKITFLAQDPDPLIREQFCQFLARAPELPKLDPLLSLLQDPVLEVRISAFLGLLKIGSVSSLSAFYQYYQQVPPSFREAFSELFYSNLELLSVLQEKVQSAQQPQVRLLALRILIELDIRGELLPQFFFALKDPSPVVRREIAKAIFERGLQIPPELLQQLSQDPDPYIRELIS